VYVNPAIGAPGERSSARMQELHGSVMAQVLCHVDAKSRVKLGSVSKLLQSVLQEPENWTDITFEDAASQSGLHAEDLLRLLQRTAGKVQVVHGLRQPVQRRGRRARRGGQLPAPGRGGKLPAC
jgi:hypothetical protein